MRFFGETRQLEDRPDVDSPAAPAPSLPGPVSQVVNSFAPPASGPSWLSLENTTKALQQDQATRASLQEMLATSGDSRTPEQWLLDDLKEGDSNGYFQDIVQKASYPLAATQAVNDFNKDETPVNFFSPPPTPSIPSPIQNVIDAFIGGSGSSGIGTVAPTPNNVGSPGPDVVVAPVVTTNNTFSQVVNYIQNFFGGTAGETTTSPQAPLPPVEGFQPPSNGAPLVNSAALGNATTPDTFKQGQVIDQAQSGPYGIPARVAGIIRGFEIPGLSKIKNDRTLILATLAAPLLGLLALWLIKKFFFRGK